MKPVLAADGLIEQVIPGSFASWKSEEAAAAPAGTGDRVLCILGTSGGGAPRNPMLFTLDDRRLNTSLLSGELLQASRFALGRGAAGVVAVNVSGGSPATFVVEGTVEGEELGTLTTVAYREPANATRFAVVGNPQDGYTVEIRNSVTETDISSNRVGLGLYVQYTGAGKATLEIDDVAGVRTLSTTVEGAPEDNVSIALTDLTISALIQRLQEAGPYNARYARDARLMATGLDLTTAPVAINAFPIRATVAAPAIVGATSLTVAALPAPIAANTVLRVKTAGGYQAVTVTAGAAAAATSLTVAALAAPIANGTLLFGNSVQAAPALSAVKADFQLFFERKANAAVTFVPGNAALPKLQAGYFTGGATLVPTADDWEAAAQAAVKAFPFGQAVALQEDRGIAAGLRSIFQSRRNPKTSEPVQFFESLPEYVLPQNNTAAEIAAYKTEVKNEIAGVNDRDSVIIAQTQTGNLTPSGLIGREKMYMVALRVAAARAALGPGVSLTAKTIGGTNPLPALDDDADEMARAGLLVLNSKRVNDPSKIVLGRTAYVGDDNLHYEMEKSVAIMNAVTRGVRLIGAETVPGESTVSTLADYERNLTEYLDEKVNANWITAGRDSRGNLVPAYEIRLFRTSFQGRLATTKIPMNPTPELLMTDAELIARSVEIEVSR